MDLLSTLLEALASPEHPEGDEGRARLRELMAEADAQAVDDLRAQALERFDDLFDADAVPSEDELATLARLNEVLEVAAAEAQARGEAAQAARDRAAELAQRAHAAAQPAPADDGDDGDGGGVAAADPPPPDGPPAAAPPAPVAGEVLVASSSQPPARRGGPFSGLPRANPPARPRTRVEMTAAADVPGFPSGAPLHTMDALVRATQNRFSAMPKGNTAAQRVEVGLAVINRHRPDAERFECNGDQRDESIVASAADEHRLPGGSLVAAASWCAEPETDYTLCPPLSTEWGLWDTPSVTVRRGAVRLPTWPDYQTIAEAISGQILCPPNLDTPKVCITAPCPQWADHVACAVPLCITNNILQERSYPEGTARFLSEVGTAQRHMVNAYKLAQAEAAADDVIPSADLSERLGATQQLFDHVSLLVEWIRDLYRMSDTAALEMVAPAWLPGVLRADARKRTADGGDWTTAQINGRLNALGAAPQWVRDWQPLAVGTVTGTPPNTVTTFNPPTAWPTSVKILLYPAGTYVTGEDEIINLNAVYDNAMLKTNSYTALFAEEMVTVIKRCHRAAVVTVNLCVAGNMGAQVDNCAVVTP
jgi:hypothetical protein